ncbi:MAG: glutathione S-transferase family protein, partial [Pseudomonadota bacterium]
FGIKSLAWRSVQIPMTPPKPDLIALTGGYRKTPTLQIGADIYCDTQLIAREIERRAPEPTLYPTGEVVGLATQIWADGRFFEPGAGLSLIENADQLPDDLRKDREAYFTFLDFTTIETELPHMRGQFRAHAALTDRQLADGRAFLTGDAPAWADVNAFHVVWMARGNIPTSKEFLAPYAHLARWETRMAELGHGTRTDIPAEDAIALAKGATPEPTDGVDPTDPLNLSAGDAVAVAADDYGKDPVSGELVTLTTEEIAVRRSDARAGDLIVHFPRIGFRVRPA